MLILPIVLNIAMANVSEPIQWQAKQAPIMTRWAKQVSPDNVHPEYPRPQLVRKDWLNLNGLWDLAIKNPPGSGLGRPDWQGKILVPFPVESALSGVMQRVDPNRVLEYRRSFTVPAKWKGKRVLMHFGAVDFESTVRVNGKKMGTHRGGYDAFSYDITDALKAGANEVLVTVSDPSETGSQPHGKQYLKNEGIWYTPTSGIWQTVWLEPVEEHSIAGLKVETALDGTVKIAIQTRTAPGAPRKRSYFEVELKDGAKTIKGRAVAGATATLKVPKPMLWSPESPTLYPITVHWGSDVVAGYVGIRTIGLGKDKKGRTRIALNGRPYFLVGPLDQGFWPDGLYTAPSDAALKYDLEITKKLGFNFVRKHVKVEPARWYYWCDKLGLAVFQDMPSGEKYIGGNDPDITRTKESGDQFEAELKAMIDGLESFPSIVGWVPYNEGWGQWDTARIAKMTKDLDPTRLVDSASGWTDRGVGDLFDWHVYPGPGSPKPEAKRAAFLGEFGGLGLPMPGHMWKETGWGYRSYKTQAELTDGIVSLFANLRLLIDNPGLSGAVYTQTTDVETETNGLMTYDRAVIKPNAAQVAKAVKALFLPPPKVTTLLPTSEDQAQDWRYTTTKPSSDEDLAWALPGFDDSGWKGGKGGFGTQQTPGAVVGTVWNSADIWIRRTFMLGKIAIKNPHLRIHHDEDAEIYLNGKLLAKVGGYTTGYVLLPIPKASLVSGKHTLAVHCKQTAGGQFIDIGIVDVAGE